MAEDIEAELLAMKTLVETLEPLKVEVRTRVIEYVFKVLGIAGSQLSAPPIPPTPLGQPATAPPQLKLGADHPTDILSLKEEIWPTALGSLTADPPPTYARFYVRFWTIKPLIPT